MKILVAIGTRPEAIKMAPVILALKARAIATQVLFTGQHKELALPVLELFDISVDFRFSEAIDSFSLHDVAASYLRQTGALVESVKPDMMLVQGDTTTAFAAAIASYYQKCPVGHIEAGLRTHDPYSPFPEENHRHIIDTLSTLHFAPSDMAKEALLAEGISSSSISVTGNTVIDALQWVLHNTPDPGGAGERPFILVTAHRRENFGELHQRYFVALNRLAQDMPDIRIVFVMHPNPNVKSLARQLLIAPSIDMIEPVGYAQFIHLMKRSILIVTDSGGIQEESAFLGKPTVVIREHTDRKELLDHGNLIMVGTDGDRLQRELCRLLTDSTYYKELSRVKLPYGNGNASSQIVDKILQWQRPVSH